MDPFALAPASMLALMFAFGAPDGAPTEAPTEAPAKTKTRPVLPDIVAPMPDEDYVRRVNGYARGVGIGIQQGVWGKGFGQSLHIDVPFGRRVGQFFGLRLAGTFVHGSIDDVYDPVGFGHVEVFGRSPVLAGVLRAYGGGGVRIGGRPVPDITGARYGVAGGGQIGLEAFVAPRVSINVEIGVQGPVHDLSLDAGGSAMAGVTIWLGDVSKKRR